VTASPVQEDKPLRRSVPISLAVAFLLTACNSVSRPSTANFRAAIDRYLANQGKVCISVGGQLPIDVPVSGHNALNGTSGKLTALEHAGLVSATDTTAVVRSLADSLSLSPRKPEPVKRYAPSSEGREFLQTVMTDSGRTDGFCYGQKQVDSILKWTGSSSQVEVTYTYKIANLAAWAKRPDMQQAFPVIATVLNGASRDSETAGLQLTSGEWQVPQP